MNMNDAEFGKLPRQFLAEKAELVSLERDITDTANHLARLAETLHTDTDAVQVRDSNDGLSLYGVDIPYTALQSLADSLTKLDKLRIQHSHTRTALSNQGADFSDLGS